MCRVDSRRGGPPSAQVWQQRPLWAQLRGTVSRASQREASAHQGDGCWLPVTLASLQRARAKELRARRAGGVGVPAKATKKNLRSVATLSGVRHPSQDTRNPRKIT